VWTHPLPLAAVPHQMSLKLAGGCECPAAAELGARERTFTGVQMLVLLQPTQAIKTSTAAVNMTLQRLAADEVLSTM